MTSLPDWLLERAALDELSPRDRDRLSGVDPGELAEQIATLREANAAELASHPAAPAVSQIEARIAFEHRRRTTRRRRWQLGVLGLAGAATVVLAVGLTRNRAVHEDAPVVEPETERVKGSARLLAFRLVGDTVEQLEQDALVHAGDLIQLRYNAGGHSHGVIASIDGGGAVTLHHPASEGAPAGATALATKTTALPHAYALDDAPQFERFFIITANEPVDVRQSMESLRALARRADRASATPELPAGARQWSLRLRKPDRPSHPPSPEDRP